MSIFKRKEEKEGKKTIAVFFGGASYEREISILTGIFVANVLKDRYNVLPVYIDSDGNFYTSPYMFKVSSFTVEHKSFTKIVFVRKNVYKYPKLRKKIATVDGAINCCHGGFGEGGGISALMQIYDIPLASPDMAVSALGMDKCLCKSVISGMGIPCLRSVVILKEHGIGKKEGVELQKLGYPLVLKPARLGSSIGIKVVHNEAELKEGLEYAFTFDDKVLAEEYLPNKRDINCAAYRYRDKIYLSECEEPFSMEEILSFREKYLAGGKNRKAKFPADLPQEISEKVRGMSKAIYQNLQMKGIVRFDFLVAGENVYFNEVNTVPGSLAYYLFSQKVSKAEKLFSDLIEEAMEEKAHVAPMPEFTTNILQQTEYYIHK